MTDRPKRPRRPRGRRNPEQKDDDDWFVSGKPHRCALCGAVEAWSRRWRWFGSMAEMEAGAAVTKLCSQECQDLYEEEHGKQEEPETVVVKAVLRPTAFDVECPCCGIGVEVPDWKQDQHGAYCHEDTMANLGPFVKCNGCGVLIEPEAVAVRTVYEVS